VARHGRVPFGRRRRGGEPRGGRAPVRSTDRLDPGKKKAELTDGDHEHMRTVVGYVHRHLAQRPEKEELGTSRWRYSLMNWGHDPLKR